jgi:predicted kinase
LKKAEVALYAGHSAIVDAVFPEEAGRAALRELAQGAGVEFWGFWLEAGAAVIRERIAAREAGAADASDAGIAVAEAQMKARSPRGWTQIDASARKAAAAVGADSFNLTCIGLGDRRIKIRHACAIIRTGTFR